VQVRKSLGAKRHMQGSFSVDRRRYVAVAFGRGRCSCA
jgi:hypothetical protein